MQFLIFLERQSNSLLENCRHVFRDLYGYITLVEFGPKRHIRYRGGSSVHPLRNENHCVCFHLSDPPLSRHLRLRNSVPYLPNCSVHIVEYEVVAESHYKPTVLAEYSVLQPIPLRYFIIEVNGAINFHDDFQVVMREVRYESADDGILLKTEVGHVVTYQSLRWGRVNGQVVSVFLLALKHPDIDGKHESVYISLVHTSRRS
jgi:hypothetical protein